MKKLFSLEELRGLNKDELLIKIREIVPDPMEVTLLPEEIRALEVIAETERLRAKYDHKDQEASRWQDIINDLAIVAQGRPYQRRLY